MMNGMELYVKAVFIGLATGLAAAVPLGPAGLEAVKRTISRGYNEGFMVSLGSVSADAFDILLINFGILGVIQSNKFYENIFWVISGIGLCIVGYMQIHRERKHQKEAVPGILNNKKVKSRPFVTGFLIAFFNPLTHSFWLTMSGTVIRVWRYTGTLAYYIFIAFIIAGMIGWMAILNFFALKGRKVVTKESSNKLSVLVAWIIFAVGVGFITVGAYGLIVM